MEHDERDVLTKEKKNYIKLILFLGAFNLLHSSWSLLTEPLTVMFTVPLRQVIFFSRPSRLVKDIQVRSCFF